MDFTIKVSLKVSPRQMSALVAAALWIISHWN